MGISQGKPSWRGQTRTPRSQCRVLISPLDDGLLGDDGVRGELLSNDVIRVDEIVRVACQRVNGRRENSQSEQSPIG